MDQKLRIFKSTSEGLLLDKTILLLLTLKLVIAGQIYKNVYLYYGSTELYKVLSKSKGTPIVFSKMVDFMWNYPMPI